MTARVEVWRGTLVESVHRVAVVVADARGVVRARAGRADRTVVARSAVKPFQALPLVEDGVAARYGLTGEELALACGSHSGEPMHVAAAASVLRRIGAAEDALACGAQRPLGRTAARLLAESGGRPGRLHNNCSGKHAGMLALARLHDWPLEGYHRAGHAVQQRMLAEIARWAELPADELGTAVDGCGVVTFALALERLAGAFGRFAAAVRRGGTAAADIAAVMLAHPEYVAGSDRLCTALMRCGGGRIVAKVGAEGVYCAAVPGAELGIALKVEDGGRRAAEPALLAVLAALGVLDEDGLGALAAYASPELTNTRGEAVGRLHARIVLEAVHG